MKLGLHVKLGFLVVLFFGIVLLVCLFWTPLKIQYYLIKVRSSDVQKSIEGIDRLFALEEKGVDGLLKGFPEGADAAKLLLGAWNLELNPEEEKRPSDVWFTPEGARKTYGRPRVPLAVAAQNGYMRVCEILIAKGADVNAVDASGVPALHRAAKNGYRNIVELLIDRGAEINAPDDEGHTPLYHAVGTHEMGLVKLLIDRGADADGKPVIGRVVDSSAKYSSWMPRTGASRNPDLPLHRAVLENYIYIAAALIESGANVNAMNGDRQASLHFAAKAGSGELVEFLASKGAAIDIKDIYDNTPLHVAAMGGKREAVEAILKHGPDLGAVDARGHTPAEVAESRGFKEIAELLRAGKKERE